MVRVYRPYWWFAALFHLFFYYQMGPIGSFDKYPAFAQLVLSGKLRGESAAAPSPLYLLMNCVFSPFLIKLIQVVVGILVLRALYLLAFRLGGVVLGITASLLLAGTRSFLIYEKLLEPDFLWMGFFFLGVEICQRSFGRGSAKSDGFSGCILLGFSASLRPLVLPAAVFCLGATLWKIHLQEGRTFLLKLRRGLPAFLFAFLGPVFILHLWIGTPLGGVMDGGVVFYEGNRPEGVSGDGSNSPLILKLYEKQWSAKNGTSEPDPVHLIYRQFARSALGNPQANLREIQSFWSGYALQFLKAHPWTFFVHQLKKMTVALVGSSSIDVRAARAAEYEWRNSWVPWSSFWVFGLGLAGVIAFSVFWVEARILVCVWAILTSSLAVFYVSDRYLILLLPFVSLFGAAFLFLIIRSLVSVIGGRRDEWMGFFKVSKVLQQTEVFRVLAFCAAGGLLAAILPRLDFISETRHLSKRLSEATENWSAIQKELVFGHWDLAETFLKKAETDFPLGDWEVSYHLLPFESVAAESAKSSLEKWGRETITDRTLASELYLRAGVCGSVEELACLKEGSWVPHYYDQIFDPSLFAGECAVKRRDWVQAEKWASQSLERMPGNSEALAWALALALHKGEGGRAAGLRQELFALHDPLSAGYRLAKTLRLVGELEGAQEELSKLESLLPDFFLFQYEQALLFAAEGKWLESTQWFNRSIEAYSTFNYPVKLLDSGFARLSLTRSQDPEVAVARIRQLARMGRRREAWELSRLWVKRVAKASKVVSTSNAARTSTSSGISSTAKTPNAQERAELFLAFEKELGAALQ